MTFLENFVEPKAASLVADKELWWNFLEEGYLRVQSGNSKQVYFYTEEGSLVSREFDDPAFKWEKFHIRDWSIVEAALSNRSRRYHIFRQDDIIDLRLKGIIRRKQGNINILDIPKMANIISELTNSTKFNEELL
jgi:hypothetical protein